MFKKSIDFINFIIAKLQVKKVQYLTMKKYFVYYTTAIFCFFKCFRLPIIPF